MICFVAFMVFRSFHFDYDAVLVDELSADERKRLLQVVAARRRHHGNQKAKTQ